MKNKKKLVWKYTELVEVDSLNKLEEFFNIKFPLDYKKNINEFNAGKPSLECFDLKNRSQCVLDYMLNVNPDSKTSIQLYYQSYKPELKNGKLVPFAQDPFGNLLAFSYSQNNTFDSIVFIDHESNTSEQISKSFSDFISMLY